MSSSGGTSAADDIPFYYTKGPFWENKKWYSLWLLQLLTILPTGFFGMDHLFLRSPLTALAKGFVNVCFLGIWYMYDLLQVTLDKENVQKFGLSVPIYGPTGIGAGTFVEPGEDATEGALSPWRFMIYCLLTCLPFGLDFFAAGDLVGGSLRFLTTIIIFLWPLGFMWGCYNMYRAWITPGDVMTRGVYRIWPYSMFIDKYFPVVGVLGPGTPGSGPPVCREKGIVETLMEPVNTVLGVATSVIAEPVKTGLDNIAAIPLAVSVPLKAAMNAASPTITAGVKIAQVVPPAIAAVPAIAANVGNKIEAASNPQALLAKASQAVVPTAPIMERASFPPTSVMVGGGSSTPFSDAAVLFTLGLLVFGGGILSFIRSRDIHGETKENDSPPKPRGVRKTPTTA